MDNKIITELQDLTYLSWSKIRNSSGTAGSFLKAFDDFGTRKKYYKLSNYSYNDGIIGHESVNEIIVDRLLTVLGIPHLEYKLIHAKVVVDDIVRDTYVCMSEDFKEKGESKIALDSYFQFERLPKENLYDFCIRNGWGNYIYQMLIVDFLILNRDRHGANIEVIRNKKTNSVRLAPLFDHGLSLMFSCNSEELINDFDVLSDGRVQCCVGGNSTLENLNLIPKEFLNSINALKKSDEEIIMCGLENIIGESLRKKIWEMIWKRWKKYEDFCNKR